MNFLPPPVTPSDEEPIAAGGRQSCCENVEAMMRFRQE
jgi:hypothetical protein